MITLQVGNNSLPFDTLNFTSDVPVDEIVRCSLRILPLDPFLNSVPMQNIIAQVGTAVLEFNKLSQYSGNSTYRTLAEKAMRQVATNVSPEYGECLLPNSVFTRFFLASPHPFLVSLRRISTLHLVLLMAITL